jgi:hypothetical protein
MGCAARHSGVFRVAGALPPKGGVPGPWWYWMGAPRAGWREHCAILMKRVYGIKARRAD